MFESQHRYRPSNYVCRIVHGRNDKPNSKYTTHDMHREKIHNEL